MNQEINQSVQIMPDVLSQEVSGETVLLDLNHENYFGLNEVGTRIWQLLQSEDDLSKMYQILLEEYDVEADKLKHDFDDIIKQLADAKIISLQEV